MNTPACLSVVTLSLSLLRTRDQHYPKLVITDSPKCSERLKQLSYVGMFKNNEAFHFMASYAHICLDFKDQT